MGHRFEGQDGKRRLIEAICSQSTVSGDEQIATDLANIMKIEELIPGTEIITQGSFDSNLYFILVGEASVIINGREISKRVSGSHVGEMSVIDPTAKRSATVRITESSLVGIVTEQDFSTIANKYPKVWRRISIELANRLRQRSKYHRQPNEKPMIFIGSSKETLNIAEKIKSEILTGDFDVTLWTEGVFGASQTTIESLEQVLKVFDFGIIVFGQDDLIESRNVMQYAPRDNTVFELGLLMGAFGRERTYIVRSNSSDLKIPSDLLGISCVSINESDLTSIKSGCERLKAKITTLGPR